MWEWKTQDHENMGVEKAGLENAGPNLAGVEKAGPLSMERKWISINV